MLDPDTVNKLVHKYGNRIGTLITANYANDSKQGLIKKYDIEHMDININSVSYHSIVNGLGSDEELLPIDDWILSRVSMYEDQIYRMITRSSYKIRDFYKLRRIYLKHLKYWNHIILTRKINLYVARLPHNVLTYIPYILCNIYGIKTLDLRVLNLLGDDYAYINYNPDTSIIDNNELIAYKRYTQPDMILNEKFNTYYEAYVLHKVDTKPQCIKPFSQTRYFIKSRYLGLVQALKAGKPFLIPLKLKEIVFGRLGFLKNKLYLKNKYYQPCRDDKYFLFAMHYQPECTTLPWGGRYVDQLLAINIISDLLPEDVLLYVKEHPNQFTDYGREYNFYKELCKLRNVRILKAKSSNTNSLIDNAMAVASVTGTILLEAVCNKKPGIMFGDYIYKCAPGILSVRNAEDVKRAINQIMLKEIKITNLELMAYFKQLESTTFYHSSFDITSQELYNEIEKIIEKLLI